MFLNELLCWMIFNHIKIQMHCFQHNDVCVRWIWITENNFTLYCNNIYVYGCVSNGFNGNEWNEWVDKLELKIVKFFIFCCFFFSVWKWLDRKKNEFIFLPFLFSSFHIHKHIISLRSWEINYCYCWWMLIVVGCYSATVQIFMSFRYIFSYCLFLPFTRHIFLSTFYLHSTDLFERSFLFRWSKAITNTVLWANFTFTK